MNGGVDRRSGLVRRISAAVARRLPRPIRGALTDRTDRTDRGVVVSVVIPTFNVEPYLRECLDSVLAQSLAELEVIVVDDGSSDRSLAIAEDVARADHRVTVLTQPHGGQGAARNLGVVRARGRYLMFCDGDDTLPADALRTLVATLRSTRSDFVLAPVLRLRPSGTLRPPVWNATVFSRQRLGVRIDEVPRAMFDVLACNRLFVRSFWTEKVGTFPGGIAYEDHEPMVRAFLRAERFDIITEPIYHWRVRADGSSTRQQKHRRSNLVDRLMVKEHTWPVVQALSGPSVRAAWLGRVLDLDLTSFIGSALDSDEHYRALLSEGFRRYFELADDAALRHVRAHQRVLGWLVGAGRWDDVATVLERLAACGGQLPTEVEDAEVVLAARVLTGLSGPVPRALAVVAEYESELDPCLRDLGWSTGRLIIHGWAPIRMLEGSNPVVELSLVEIGGGRERIALDPVARPDAEATRWTEQRQASADAYGFTVIIDAADRAVVCPGRWQFEVVVIQDGARRRGEIRQVLPHSSAALKRLPAWTTTDGWLVSPVMDPALGLVLEVTPLQVQLAQLPELIGSGVAGRLAPSPGIEVTEVLARAKRPLDRPGRVEADGSFAVALSASADRVRMLVRDHRGTSYDLGWPPGRSTQPSAAAHGSSWRSTPAGGITLVASPLAPSAITVAVDDDSLLVSASHESSDHAHRLPADEVWLRGGRAETRAHRVTSDGDLTTYHFSLVDPAQQRPLPLGVYWLVYGDRGRAGYGIPIGDGGQTPVLDVWSRWHRVRVGVSAGGSLRLSLRPRLVDGVNDGQVDELGDFAQQRLRERFPATDSDLRRDLLFCGAGLENPTVAALISSVPPGPSVWMEQRDPAHAVPARATAIVPGSAAWYDVVAHAGTLCCVRPPGWLPLNRGGQHRLLLGGDLVPGWSPAPTGEGVVQLVRSLDADRRSGQGNEAR